MEIKPPTVLHLSPGLWKARLLESPVVTQRLSSHFFDVGLDRQLIATTLTVDSLDENREKAKPAQKQERKTTDL